MNELDQVNAMSSGKLTLSEVGQKFFASKSISMAADSLYDQILLLSFRYQELRYEAAIYYRDSNGGGSPVDPAYKEKNEELQPVTSAINGPYPAANAMVDYGKELDKIREAIALLDKKAHEETTQSMRQLQRLLPQALNGLTEQVYGKMGTLAASWQGDVGTVLRAHDNQLDMVSKDYLRDSGQIAELIVGKIAELQMQHAQANSQHP